MILDAAFNEDDEKMKPTFTDNDVHVFNNDQISIAGDQSAADNDDDP